MCFSSVQVSGWVDVPVIMGVFMLVLIPGLKDDVMVQGLHQLYARCAHRRPVVVDLVWPASLEALLDIPVIEFTHRKPTRILSRPQVCSSLQKEDSDAVCCNGPQNKW